MFTHIFKNIYSYLCSLFLPFYTINKNPKKKYFSLHQDPAMIETNNC